MPFLFELYKKSIDLLLFLGLLIFLSLLSFIFLGKPFHSLFWSSLRISFLIAPIIAVVALLVGSGKFCPNCYSFGSVQCGEKEKFREEEKPYALKLSEMENKLRPFHSTDRIYLKRNCRCKKCNYEFFTYFLEFVPRERNTL